jgi:kinesin family member 5
MASAVRVVCRFRPQQERELAKGGQSVVSFGSQTPENGVVNSVQLRIPDAAAQTFAFDRIFPPESSQAEVYDSAAKPVVEDVLRGFNGTIFVYGQTSSGKTHTMQGPSVDHPELRGIIPRMIHTVFQHITQADPNIEFVVKASYLEIYMERIRDLLSRMVILAYRLYRVLSGVDL